MGGRVRSSGVRRGFAMPMVILLSVVIAMGIGVAVTRQVAQSRTVARQIRAYQEHHAAQGLQEAIGAFVQRIDAREIDDATGEDGHALDLELQGGDVARVYFVEAQGTLLTSLGGLSDDALQSNALALERLLASTTPERYREVTRRVGPWEVSPRTAPAEVLRAAIGAITEDDRIAQSVTDEIIARRERERIGWSEVSFMLEGAGASDADRRALQRMFTFDPELWFVRVDVKPRGTRRLSARYGGLTYIPAGSRRGRSGQATTGVFLTWENLGVEP